MYIGKEISENFGPTFQKGSGGISQRGEGIGGIFSKIFRFIKPGLSKIGNITKKALTSDTAKQIGTEALNTGISSAANILGDVILGEDPIASAEAELQNVRTKIGNVVKNIGKTQQSGVQQINNRNRKKRKQNISINNKRKKTLLD